jgi:hypothetical protein
VRIHVDGKYLTQKRPGGPNNLDEAIEELRQITDSTNDILAEAAGITARSW